MVENLRARVPRRRIHFVIGMLRVSKCLRLFAALPHASTYLRVCSRHIVSCMHTFAFVFAVLPHVSTCVRGSAACIHKCSRRCPIASRCVIILAQSDDLRTLGCLQVLVQQHVGHRGLVRIRRCRQFRIRRSGCGWFGVVAE